jgi:hypothetical protein
LAPLRHIAEDQVRMTSGLASLNRNLAGTVGIALTATLMEARGNVHTLNYSQRQMLYPLATAKVTETIRGVLIQDNNMGVFLSPVATMPKYAGVSRVFGSYRSVARETHCPCCHDC